MVTGATAIIGGALGAPAPGKWFRGSGTGRNPDKLSAVPWRDAVEVARGDLDDGDSLVAAFDDVDVV